MGSAIYGPRAATRADAAQATILVAARDRDATFASAFNEVFAAKTSLPWFMAGSAVHSSHSSAPPSAASLRLTSARLNGSGSAGSSSDQYSTGESPLYCTQTG